MRFAEAEQRYRELEDKLVRGELSEGEFLTQVAELRLVDRQGRRWMLSGRSGRWLLYDGQQWVFAEPPEDELKADAEAEAEAEIQAEEEIEAGVKAEPVAEGLAAAAPVVAPTPESPVTQDRGPRPLAFRLLMMGIAAVLLFGCLITGSVAAWVFVLRDRGEATSLPAEDVVVAVVETYTPRPATPTYTPTFTPTPSRTPTPTNTSIPTNTPIPSASPVPTDTPFPTSTWTPRPVTPTRQPTTVTPTTVARVTPTASSLSASATPGAQTYTIRVGDTLSDIAARFGVSAQALAEANGITNPALIRPGQVLVIPVPGATASPSSPTYTIKPGDTLSEIASRFGVSAQALAEANGITNPALIRPGQVLIIPLPGTTPAAVTPTPTWTPIVVTTATAARTATATKTSTATSTATSSPTPTRSGPTSTPKPTNTPRPTAIPTAKPAAVTGKIAFTVWNRFTLKYELYVSRIDGGGRNMLGEGFRQPQFRPDGNLLAVNGHGASNLEHLVTMDPSGGGKVGVSKHAEDSFPSWSPDGAIVAYSSDSWGDGKSRLGIVHDMFGPQQDWIPVGNLQVEGDYPYWMSDGRIVYHGCDFVSGGGNCGLYWVGAGGGSYHRVTTHESDTAPAGSGSRVAFMSARDGNWEVYVVDLNGGALKRLTNNGAHDGLPTWSPDGKSIAFVSNRGGAWAIWVMAADGSSQRKLFDLGGGYGPGDLGWTRERISWAP